jgi:hypothetical protein
MTVLPGAASVEPRTVPGVANDGGAGVERVSVAADGPQGDGDSAGATITADGRRIAFSSFAKNLTSDPSHDMSGPSLVLRDLKTGSDEVGSAQPATAGTDAVGTGGRDVAFHSTADDIVMGDTNNKTDVFRRRFY